MQGGADVQAQVAMDQVEQVEIGRPGGGLEIAAGAAGEVQHLVLFVDQHIGGRMPLDDLLRPAAEGGRDPRADAARQRLGQSTHAMAGSQREFRKHPGDGLQPPEHPVAPVDGSEQLGVAGDVLRRAEEQVAAGRQ